MKFRGSQDALLRLGEILRDRTGISLKGLRQELVTARLNKRMTSLGLNSFEKYVDLIERNEKEVAHFINLMTTNHTYFFREKPHIDFLRNVFFPRYFENINRELNILCAACSTGEEAYTVGMLVADTMREMGIRRNVRISGTDINTEAIRLATNGVYPSGRLNNVPKEYRSKYFRQGRYPHEDFFKVSDEVKKMVRFYPLNLISPVQMFNKYDLVMCRNVLIYFEPQTIRQVVGFLRSLLSPEGIFISGLSEHVEDADIQLRHLGRSIHAITNNSIYAHQQWESKGGGSALKKNPGASFSSMGPSAQSAAELSYEPVKGPNGEIRELITIGASTGGVEALCKVLAPLPRNCAPIMIAQHIPKGHSTNLAMTLARSCRLKVVEAQGGMLLEHGHVYVAPGGSHLRVRQGGERLICDLMDESQIDARFTPSVDYLFESAARLSSIRISAAILTGMGDDGTKGAKALRARGHRVVVQDEKTSLIWGMPGSAAEAKAADAVLPIHAIGGALLSAFRRKRAA